MRVLFLLLCLFFSSYAFLQQSVAVKGKLLCGEQALQGAKVKLWDKNRLSEDDLLVEGVTDANGTFQLEGRNSGLFKMHVHLKIYHDCEDGVKPCQRKISIRVPSDFVFRSETPEQIYDVDVLDMSKRSPDEERSCIN
ncbi:hypothetical protein PFISCL1PPCAC_27757 [Pristionchus fissidentatus]|uniref:Transthyretin-like protein n=1 Tax=Pristionchus fissidentatus TaxID=1538716 RepID=A0AAV5X0M4_9BILA|nr:hypothetical protein PFISCL1PPCAC_27757 [Pristionchus fissidentatus]